MGNHSMAGTRRAYELCAGCKHPRIRHTIGGHGHCSHGTWVTDPGVRQSVPRFETCTCVMFTTEQKVS